MMNTKILELKCRHNNLETEQQCEIEIYVQGSSQLFTYLRNQVHVSLTFITLIISQLKLLSELFYPYFGIPQVR